MKKILFTALILCLSMSTIYAQDKDKKDEDKVKLNMKVKDGAHPDVYIDGKKFEFSVDLIDPDRIATMNVIKGQEAMTKYDAPNGVILITTKPKIDDESSTFTITDNGKNDNYEVKTKIRLRNADAKDPLIIIDGKEATRVELKKLNTDNIEKIEVVKDKAAKEGYDADNGVIIVKTKAKKKEDKAKKKEK